MRVLFYFGMLLLLLALTVGGCSLVGQLYEGTLFTNDRRYVIQDLPADTAKGDDAKSH